MAKLYDSKKPMSIAFDDVLLVPQHSDIYSRLGVDINTSLTRNIKISHPVVSTNMSTVTEYDMAEFMGKSGSAGFLHRFDPKNMIICAKRLKDNNILSIPSVGAKDEDKKLVDQLAGFADAILIDIAHGDSLMVVNMVKYIKQNYPSVDVIAGNIATSEGFRRLADAGADSLRIGISGGAVCSTKFVTGSGLSTLQSIIDCQKSREEYKIPLIADGGFKTPGCCIKALAFGADVICLGNMLASTSKTPGDVLHLENGDYKEYFGMSSSKAQEKYRSGLKRGTAAEGIDKLIPYKGETSTILETILGGIRSGLTYSGARNIQELYENSEYYILKTPLDSK